MNDKEKNNEQPIDLNEVSQVKKGYESLRDKAVVKLNETKKKFNEKVNSVADKTKNFIDKHGKKVLVTLFASTALWGGLSHFKNITYEDKTVDNNDVEPGAVTGNNNPDAEKDVDETLNDLGYDSDGGDNNKKSKSGVVTPEEEKVEATYESNGNTQKAETKAVEEKAAEIKVENNQQEIQKQNEEIKQDVDNGKVKTELDKGVEATTGGGQAEEKNTTVKEGTTTIQSQESKSKETSTPEVENRVTNIAPQNNTKPQASNEITNNTDTSSKETREATGPELDDLLSR